MNIAIILLIVDWLVFNYVFKYQRVTLILSRKHTGSSNAKYQALLSPVWIGMLGWLINILHIATAVSFFLLYGWIYAVIYLIVSYIGYGFIDSLVPIPSTHHYFKLIKQSLKNDIERAEDEINKNELEKLFQRVVDTEKAENL